MTTRKGLDKALLITAFTSLKENGEPTDERNVYAEVSRITRAIEHEYKSDKTRGFHFINYASNFLKDNFKEIIWGDKYLGQYLDDVKDVKDESFNEWEF